MAVFGIHGLIRAVFRTGHNPNCPNDSHQKRRSDKPNLKLFIFIFGFDGLVRSYAAGMFMAMQTPPDAARLTWLERVADSPLHALQTFSMDEDYTTYILSGKAMMEGIFGMGTAWAAVYGIFASVLTERNDEALGQTLRQG